MKRSSRWHFKLVFGFFVFCALVSLPWPGAEMPGLGMAQAKIIQGQVVSEEADAPLDRTHPQIQAAMVAQERHTPWLMALPDVVGTATGVSETGRPAILVFTRRPTVLGAFPSALDGLPVVVQVTGEFVSMATPHGKGPPKDSVDPKSRFTRPVPIGVSTGNENECSAGTIGARVKDVYGNNIYALSNNHVYALENNALRFTSNRVLQPGLYDTGCVANLDDNVIGTLYAFEPIVFSTSANNVIDAAIALSSTANLGNATPTGGYGAPQPTTVGAVLTQAVQKYGRTTKLTKGTITGINATVNVGYGSSGTARFVDQIIVSGSKPFIKAGDSGSLLVTDPGRNPVGLLFAGTLSGIAIANPIGPVLTRFNVTIDGVVEP